MSPVDHGMPVLSWCIIPKSFYRQAGGEVISSHGSITRPGVSDGRLEDEIFLAECEPGGDPAK
jgi:hypothetical protein